MGLFEELTVPTRFNRLYKYFHGLGMYDLDPSYPYVDLVEPKDKLLMLVFCNKYICTPDHDFTRRVLDQDDIGEEDLEETVRFLKNLARARGDELEAKIKERNDLQDELDEAENTIEDLQERLKDLQFDKQDEEEQTFKVLNLQMGLKSKELEELQLKLGDEMNAKHDLQYEHNVLVNKFRDMEKEKADLQYEIGNMLCPICSQLEEDKEPKTE